MDDAGLRDLGGRLAEEIGRELPAGHDKRWRCPKDLRSRVISYARVCRERGEAVRDIAQRLGLVESTLARWLRAERAALAAGFRSVAIVASRDHEAPVETERPLRLVTPHGYCVEGLDAQTLAYVLRVVG